jgi:hypothetical protein
VSLAGVRKVLELEDELARARARIDELRRALDRAGEELIQAVEQVRREHRRELVPVERRTIVRSRGA